MRTYPLVSVIIPTFNRAELLVQAVESTLQQDYQPVEVIVVDDGSTDGTDEIIKKFGSRIRYLRLESKGPAEARNKGVELARGEYFSFLDDDDLFKKEKLSQQIPYLVENPQIALIACQALLLKDEDESFEPFPVFPRKTTGLVPFDEIAITPHTSVSPSASVIRKLAFHSVGGFDPEINYGEDWDLVIRLAAKYPIYYLKEALVYQRAHSYDRYSKYYLDHKKATQRYQDHLRIVEKMSQLLDESQKGLRQHAMACVEAEYAINEIANGHVGTGQVRLGRAVVLDPEKWVVGDELEDLAVRYSREILQHSGWGNAQQFLRDVWSPLFPVEKKHAKRLLRRNIGRLAMDAAFQASNEGNYAMTRSLGFKALWLDPSQVRNRGLLSILLASSFGYVSLAEMRAARR